MNREEFDNIKIGDKVTDGKQEYVVIGTAIDRKNKESCSVIVEFNSGMTLNDIIEALAEEVELYVPKNNYTKEFWSFPIDDINLVKKENFVALYPNGMRCCGCGECNIYAEPNLSNGKYGCYVCQTTRPWRLK